MSDLTDHVHTTVKRRPLKSRANDETKCVDGDPEWWALMPRHVNLTAGGVLRFIDYFGTALFAQAGKGAVIRCPP